MFHGRVLRLMPSVFLRSAMSANIEKESQGQKKHCTFVFSKASIVTSIN